MAFFLQEQPRIDFYIINCHPRTRKTLFQDLPATPSVKVLDAINCLDGLVDAFNDKSSYSGIDDLHN